MNYEKEALKFRKKLVSFLCKFEEGDIERMEYLDDGDLEAAISFKDHIKWNALLFYIPMKFKTYHGNKCISLLNTKNQKTYDFEIGFFEYFKIRRHISKIMKNIQKRRNYQTYRELFDLDRKAK